MFDSHLLAGFFPTLFFLIAAQKGAFQHQQHPRKRLVHAWSVSVNPVPYTALVRVVLFSQ